MRDIKFPDGTTRCKDWYDAYDLGQMSSYYLALLIVVTNMFHQQIFNWLGKLYRPRDTTQINFFKTFTIFIVQYLNTAIVVVVAYNSFLWSGHTIRVNNKENYLAGPFDEFDDRWMMVIGCPIALSIIF